MTVSRELFLSILALDSYNRGYGANVNVPGTMLGRAAVLPHQSYNITDETYQSWQSIGFFASMYDMTGVSGFSSGETVISYRGTNFSFGDSILDFFNSPIWLDATR